MHFPFTFVFNLLPIHAHAHSHTPVSSLFTLCILIQVMLSIHSLSIRRCLTMLLSSSQFCCSRRPHHSRGRYSSLSKVMLLFLLLFTLLLLLLRYICVASNHWEKWWRRRWCKRLTSQWDFTCRVWNDRKTVMTATESWKEENKRFSSTLETNTS